ncbi:hypothetical protein SARC_09650 [Sphaeroforma arctica JP610]|uniref:Uncharacterized protein n=1 Tax=Sphaeroforma arctica JP610 TaxID=667725 RepID=A0A0L0FN25_9EUKA|nr:hypothetical protein SARC_09650 [Sphaeroforma arctica JP610]KNC77901.1 hypothetical protein SARC_09650 [Sphaeroforma arctica JP610]|eukprot:XP_014151803.1 hypothetical protein SARC_09650 [Sphaeroforma arctica JP610]
MSRMASEQELVPNAPAEANPQEAPEAVPKENSTEEPKPDQVEAESSRHRPPQRYRRRHLLLPRQPNLLEYNK